MRNKLLFLIIIVLISGCGVRDKQPRLRVEGNDFAQLFSIADSGSFTLLEIYSPWQGGDGVVYHYYLAPDPPESGYESYSYIKTPVSSAVCMSTTHVAMIAALGKAESISAVSGPGYVSDSTVRSGIVSGRVRDIGYDSNLNNELIVSLAPGVLFVYGVGPESAGYVSRITESGIPVVYIGDYLEVDPLARAEWIRVFGEFYGCRSEAETIFKGVSERYRKIAESVADDLSERPGVMLGMPYKDKWFISPGNSYISRLIGDAGGRYLWSGQVSDISMPMSLESVFMQAMDSEFWLNTGTAMSVDEIISVDARFGELPAVIKGNLYNNTRRMNSTGGNDYWESGSVNPDRLLNDIAAILHPHLFPGYNLQYYLQLQ